MYNLNSNNVNLFSKKSGDLSKPEGAVPVRVVDIILDDTHPEWDKYGKMESLGAIKYRVIGEFGDESDPLLLDVAYPMNFNFKAYPLLNEIVLLQSAPAIDRDEANADNSRAYYTSIVNLWNNPHVNAFPDTQQGIEDLGYNYEDKANGTTDWAFMINGINDDIKKELIVLKKQKEKRDIIYKELKNKII